MSTPRMKKEAREIVKWATARGWKLDPKPNGSHHWVLRYPRLGVKFSLPATSSDWRNLYNARAKIRRMERGDR